MRQAQNEPKVTTCGGSSPRRASGHCRGKRWGQTGLTILALLSTPILAPSASAQDKTDSAKADKAHGSKLVLASLQEAFSSVAEEIEPAVVTVFSSKVIRGRGDVDSEDP